MDMDRARYLLANLLERARSSTEKVFLTSREVDALAVLLEEEILPHISPPESATATPPLSQTTRSVSLIPVCVTPADLHPDAMLCIDFGTSFSKAFVSIGNGYAAPELIDLPLGDGSAGTRLATPSELFIDGELLYFGANARHRWDDIQATTERLIDSIKQFITLNMDISALGQRAMPASQDPRQHFSQRDILVLYLAHLTALTERAVEEKGLSANIRRRFTHPAWKDEAKEQNEREMRQLMAEAVVLARSAASEFTSVIPVASARQLLDQLASIASYRSQIGLNRIRPRRTVSG